MDRLETVVGVFVVFVQLMHIIKAGLVAALSLAFVVCCLMEQPLTSFFVSHLALLLLIEIILETLENGFLRLLVALEVVTVLEFQDSLFLFA